MVSHLILKSLFVVYIINAVTDLVTDDDDDCLKIKSVNCLNFGWESKDCG